MTKQSIKLPTIYIMASKKHGTLYTGVSSILPKRVYEHKDGKINGFSKRYGCKILVYYEMHETMESAILREKQIKGGSRADKIKLIESINKEWRDLYQDIL